VFKDKVGRPTDELEVSNSMECDTFSLQCHAYIVGVGDRKGIQPVKVWVLFCWW